MVWTHVTYHNAFDEFLVAKGLLFHEWGYKPVFTPSGVPILLAAHIVHTPCEILTPVWFWKPFHATETSPPAVYWSQVFCFRKVRFLQSSFLGCLFLWFCRFSHNRLYQFVQLVLHILPTPLRSRKTRPTGRFMTQTLFALKKQIQWQTWNLDHSSNGYNTFKR